MRNEDFNGAEQDGVGMYQLTQRGGMRAPAPQSPTCTRRWSAPTSR